MNGISMKKHLYTVLIISVVILSHQLARNTLFPLIAAQGIIEVTPFFNLVEAWNTGISFGFMQNMAYGQWLLSVIAGAIMLALILLLHRTDKTLNSIGLSFILAGGLGNVIDRIRYGAVADYLDFHAYEYHWPAFNLTDTAIFIGVVLVVAGETSVFFEPARVQPEVKDQS